ncbi:MAG: TetR/AcrR family transcriptional regulator [Actinobacteria bacterium]|nr:TetR/AcrR family transcriptional regulator [Actinomycetota bacterium]
MAEAPATIAAGVRRRTQEQRSAATQAKLLDATVACLAELGYARTSTTMVCERAGVSRGAQLHHFPTKAALVAAAAERVLELRVEEFRATLGGLDEGQERVQTAIDLLWGIFCGPSAYAWQELLVAARTDDELRPHLARVQNRLRDEVAAAWHDLFPSGLQGLDSTLNAAVPKLLFAVLDGLSMHRLTGLPTAETDAHEVLAVVKMLSVYFDAVNPLEEL